MGEKLKWNSVSPTTGEPLKWGQAGAKWGGSWPDPPPEPPKKKKKTFHRKPKPQPNPDTPTTIMSTFKYKVAPNPNGGFTTRPVLGTLITEQFFMDRMATLTGLTQQQSEAAFDAVFDIICGCTAGCDHATDIRSRLRFRPTSGGTSPTPDGFSNADDINADVAISITAPKRDDWRSTLTLESMGEVGKVGPEIDSIISQENGIPDVYVPGTMEVINGNYTGINKNNPLEGVFVRSGNNPEVRIAVYGTITPTSLSFFIPANLTGPLSVRLATFINGSVRSFTYMTPVEQSA